MTFSQRRRRGDGSSATHLLGLCDVGTLDRVNVERVVPGDARHEDLVSPSAGVGAEQANLGRTVDRPVDGLAQVDVVERRTGGVHAHEVDARRGTNVEAALVDPVLLREICGRGRRETDQVDVGLARLDLQQGLIDVHVRREHDLVWVGRAASLVVRVARQHGAAARVAALDVVRPCGCVRLEAVGRVRHVRLDRREPLHREDRDEGRVRLDEFERQLLAASH